MNKIAPTLSLCMLLLSLASCSHEATMNSKSHIQNLSLPNKVLEETPQTHLISEAINSADNTTFQPKYLITRDNIKLVYNIYAVPNEKGAVLFITGWAETFIRYVDTFKFLNSLGYSVYTYDHRAQGFSQHLAPRHDVSYIHSFDDYVGDLQEFKTKIFDKKSHPKSFLMAHSMGGLIASTHAATYQREFDALVLSAPMFAFRTNGVPSSIGYAFVFSAVTLGLDKSPVLTQVDCNNKSFKQNVCTHSLESYNAKLKLDEEFPEQKITKASNGWVKAAFNASKWISKNSAKNISPTLMFQASDDHLVKNDVQDLLCKNMPNCKKIQIPGAYHELFIEDPQMVTLMRTEIAEFLKNK